jgi:hypothetical protein
VKCKSDLLQISLKVGYAKSLVRDMGSVIKKTIDLQSINNSNISKAPEDDDGLKCQD